MIKKDVPLYTYLPDQADDIYYSILGMKQNWTDYGKIQAVHLSRMLSELKRFEQDIEHEGTILKKGRVNWKVKISEGLYKNVLAYSRMLKIDAFNAIGRPRDQVNKNRVKLRAVRTMQGLDDEDDFLLAQPTVN